jgi:hypothetical protein
MGTHSGFLRTREGQGGVLRGVPQGIRHHRFAAAAAHLARLGALLLSEKDDRQVQASAWGDSGYQVTAVDFTTRTLALTTRA